MPAEYESGAETVVDWTTPVAEVLRSVFWRFETVRFDVDAVPTAASPDYTGRRDYNRTQHMEES